MLAEFFNSDDHCWSVVPGTRNTTWSSFPNCFKFANIPKRSRNKKKLLQANQHTTSNFKNIWKDYVQKTLELLWQYTFEVSCLFRSFMDYSCSLSFDCTYLLKTKKITLQIMLMLQPHTSLVTQHKKFQKIYLVLPKKMFSRFANNQMIAKQNIVLGKCYIILSSPD